MGHAFFASIDLEKLEKKELPAPFVPKIVSETDTSNFDTYFTSEKVRITPPSGSEIATVTEGDGQFKDFKTVAK